MKVAIYNDCHTIRYNHFGCELVMETFTDQLKRVDCELVGTVKKDQIRNKHMVKSVLDKADLVIVNGEGSFHHNRRNDILDIAENWPSILVNTVFEKNTTKGKLKSFKYISCRESFSSNECAKELGENVDTIPDIIFTNKRLLALKHTPKYDLIKVRHHSDLRTLNSADYFLNTLKEYKSVSSVSYHALIVSLLIGQNIQEVIKSNTHKNEGLMHDYNTDPHYIENSKAKINSLFENIHNIK